MRYCLIAVLVLGLAVPKANTITVWCTNCANEFTQLANKAQLIAMEARQIKMYADMLKNSQVAPNLPWGEIERSIARVEKGLQWGTAIVATMSRADYEFRRRFPGYGRITNYQADYQMWNKTALDTLAGVMAAGRQRREDMDRELAVIKQQRQAATGSEGRLQALQAQAALAAEVPAQLQNLQMLMMADMSSKAVYQAAMLQKDAIQEAAQEDYFTFVPQQDSGNKGFR